MPTTIGHRAKAEAALKRAGYASGGGVDAKASAEDLEAIYRGRGNAVSEMSDEAQRRNYAPAKTEDQRTGGGSVKGK